MSRSPLGITALICLLGACSGDSSVDAKSAEEAAPPPLVRVEPVELRSVRRTVETSSYLEAEHRVTVLPKVAGRVVKVLVDEGMLVKIGDPLALLDDREARSRVSQAQIQLQDSKVKLQLAQLESDASTHRVGQARIERDKAKDAHKRNEEMTRGLIAEREIEESGYAADAAVEALKVAEFEERKAKLEVNAAQNRVDEMQAKLDDANLNLEEHTIRSPLDGVVETRQMRGGETVTLSTELFTVMDPTRLVSYLRRPQRELSMIRDAREVRFTTDAWPERGFTATIDVVSPVIDETNGSFRVRVRISEKDAKDLRPGMFMRAEILTENERDALMIPKSAVVNDGADTAVFVVREGIARRIRLDAGLEEMDHLEARNTGDGGMREDDVVIVSGQRELRDQTAVEVAK